MASISCQQFSLREINNATNNFDPVKIHGHGGEGDVYLGNIYLAKRKEVTPVAVKLLNANSTEFDKEIKTVSQIHHLHLVSLLGYCNESGHKILVYEYMEKGSLSDYIKKSSNICLTWKQRLNICLGTARGLGHLHSETDQLPKGIIHRDVKPANILLDHNYVAKVSDFGMFKLSHVGQTDSAMKTALKGTSGYYAPEYVRTYEITRKIDVYAFGVVLFEVLCRQSPWRRGDDESYYVKDDEDLGIWALENVDLEIEGEISRGCLEMFTDVIGMCLQQDSNKRPTMHDVVLDLENALRLQEQEEEDAMNLQISMEQYTGFRPKAPSMIAEETRAAYEHVNTLVLDIGGALTKVGFSGYDSPQATFETGGDKKHLVEDGILPDDAYEYAKLLRLSLNYEPELNPEFQHPVLLTEPPLKNDATYEQKNNRRKIRLKVTQLMFEEFNVPAMYVAVQPVLSLYANGHTTGIVVESGEGQSYSVPIYEGHALPHAITSLPFAGHGLTNHFIKTLNFNQRSAFYTTHELMRPMKESVAYIAIDYYQELQKTSKTKQENYMLADGQRITVGAERFQCPEVLFNPHIVGMDEAQGIQKNTYNSISMCDPEIRDRLFGNIVLSGGTTMLPGFVNRMKKEMKSLAPRRSLVKIWAPENRNHGAWVGGSVLASLGTSKKMWITKNEYEEFGPEIVQTKCF